MLNLRQIKLQEFLIDSTYYLQVTLTKKNIKILIVAGVRTDFGGANYFRSPK
jgi:hypothetical protein